MGRKPSPPDPDEQFERGQRHRDAMAKRSRDQSNAASDIGEIPPVVNPARREACRLNLQLYLETYFPNSTGLTPLSPDHGRMLSRMQKCCLEGGKFANGVFRGFAKTTCAEGTVMWAASYGHRRYPTMFGSDANAASRMIDSIKSEFSGNDLLYEDFPEICHAVRALEGKVQRCASQTHGGKLTHIEWTAEKIVLPTIEGSVASACVISSHGLTAASRGLKHKRSDGVQQRPDFIIIDDPQTDEALDVDTPILTPGGFVRMGDLAAGDTVYDDRGEPCRVTGTSQVMHSRQCYLVTFDDGSAVVADAGHLWTTSTALQRTNARRKVLIPNPSFATRPQCRPRPFASTVTTECMRDSLLAEGGRNNHSVPLTDPVQTGHVALPIPPYTLGAWLGDGDSSSGRLTTADPEILDYIRADGFTVGDGCAKRNNAAASHTVHGLVRSLRAAGVLRNKHLPDAYWFASPAQRLAVLQGLMDTDGSITTGIRGVKGTRCTFTNTNPRLIEAVVYLCQSLGIKAMQSRTTDARPTSAPTWRVTFITTVPVFRLRRKASRIPCDIKPSSRRRFVASIEKVPSRPVRCIAVDSPSRLYLCGKALIPTHNSAAMPMQVKKRLLLIKKNILKQGGHRQSMACVVNGTIIAREDLMEQLLDPKRSPSWQGERIAMVKSWAARHDDLWLTDYRRIRESFNRSDPDDQARAWHDSTKFYLANRGEMDRGCAVAWDSCYEPEHEASAIQHAYNCLIDDGAEVFASEFQQQPIRVEDGKRHLDHGSIVTKANGLKAGIVPQSATTVTAFVDVQLDVLYWMVCGWGGSFDGHVVGYGVFPSQPTNSLALSDMKSTMQMAYPGRGPEAAIRAGLDVLTTQIANREWHREDGATLRTDKILVDSGNWTSQVYEFCRRSPLAGLLQASKGQPIVAKNVPMDLYKPREGEVLGDHWVIAPIAKNKSQRLLRIDTNYWKSFLRDRILTAPGDAGCLSLFGDDRSHDDLAMQWTAEYSTRTSGQGRDLEEWSAWPGRDNHLWDCLVGSAVAASMQGVALSGLDPRPANRPLRKVRYSEIQKRKKWERGA